MRRRDFIFGAAGSLAGPGLVRAESRNAVPKIGFLFPGPEEALKSRKALLVEGLSGEGFHEPDQFVIIARATGGDDAKLTPQLQELIAEGVDVLIPTGPSCMRAAYALTHTIPIVTFDLESDP